MSDVRIHMSFDPGYDGDLHDRLLDDSHKTASGFEIASQSEAGAMTGLWDERARRRIRDADEVILICTEQTQASLSMEAELRMAQEEQKPYLLLWGRRECMCTKPTGAKPQDAIYSWTWDILRDRIAVTMRNARSAAIPDRYKRA